MKHKWKALLLTAALVSTLTMGACGKDDQSKNTQNSTPSTTASSTADDTTNYTADDESRTEASSEEDASQTTEKSDVPAGEPVDASWFDDAVFIGDSVTLRLCYYCEDHDDLGEAEFLCAGSLGYNNAQMGLDEEGNVHPVYNGEKVLIDDGAAAMGAKKIFVMLGMNDIGLYGVDGAAEGMKTMMARIKEKNPDAVIYVQSVTPMLENMQLTDLNNTTIPAFNEKAKAICEENGFRYLDVASAMDDGNGNLVYEYCGDPDAMGLHFSAEGCKAWIEYLKTHVV